MMIPTVGFSNPGSAPIQVSGLASGIDTTTLINELVTLQSANLNALTAQQKQEQSLQTAYSTLDTKLNTLENDAWNLSGASTFAATAATVSDPTLLSASTDSTATVGTYNVKILQESTPAQYAGTGGVFAGGATFAKFSQDLATVVAGPPVANGDNFTINGATITYNTGDTMNSIIAQINTSSAGVTATLDMATNSMILTGNGGGPINIVNGSGNLMSDLGLAGGTYTAGQQAEVQINGGSTITSTDNIFTSAETGIQGLTFTIEQGSGSGQINVATDLTGITKNINTFVSDYNDLMSFISTNSTYSTDSSGNTQAGLFTYDTGVQALQSSLQQMMSNQVPNPPGYNNLTEIGIGQSVTSTDTTTSTVTVDATQLANALTSNIGAVTKLFGDPVSVTDPTGGIAVQMNTYLLNATTFANGLIMSGQTTISTDLTTIQSNIDNQNQMLATYRDQLTTEFTNMENVIASYNVSGLTQLLNSLSSLIGSYSSSSSSSSSSTTG
ncbi:MAG: flagellar filament capping protein FliD [Planctomycetota bacterium]